MVGYSHKLRATTTPVYLAGNSALQIEGFVAATVDISPLVASRIPPKTMNTSRSGGSRQQLNFCLTIDVKVNFRSRALPSIGEGPWQ